MKCTRIPMEAEVTKYELGKGLEDGFELFSDILLDPSDAGVLDNLRVGSFMGASEIAEVFSV